MTSIRFRIRPGGEERDSLSEHTVELPCHFSIEAKTGDDGALVLELAVRPNSKPSCPQCDHMQGAEIAARYKAINDKFAALGQVNKHNYFDVSHCNQILRFELDTSQYQQGPGPLRKVAA